jgi:hypothetical protein
LYRQRSSTGVPVTHLSWLHLFRSQVLSVLFNRRPSLFGFA